MNRILPLFLGLVAVAASSVSAQSGIPAGLKSAAERQRLEAARSGIESTFAAERASCYQVFFVNNCLADADEQRRSGLSTLRRQEILVNEQERKEKAAVQLRKLEEKARTDSPLIDVDAGRAPEPRARTVQPATLTPPATRDASSPTPSSSAKSVSRAKINQNKADARSAKAGEEALQTREYNERQTKAEERRVQHERSLRERTKPMARPLPAPP